MASRHSSILPANLLAPFAKHGAFLRSDYYRASAPPRGPHPDNEPAPDRAGYPATRATADGSHVHCYPVDGLGTRLYPCGIAIATVVDNSLRPPDKDLIDPI